MLFCVLAIVWRFGTEITISVLALLVHAAGGEPIPTTPEGFAEVMGPGVLGISFFVMATGLVVIAAGFAAWQRWPVSQAFALRNAPIVTALVALIGGLTVGIFPGWLAAWLLSNAPDWLNLGNLEALSAALSSGSNLGRFTLGCAVILGAPLFEELVFRGFLWNALERSVPTWVVWLLTSAAFALFHLDPIHVIAIFFTGLFLGWLRMVSGSIWPAILAHFVNNLWAAVGALLLPEWLESLQVWWAALAAAVITILLAALTWPFRRPHALPTPSSPA